MAVAQAVKTYQNYIGGEWRAATNGATLEVHDPGNGELVYRAPNSPVEDARTAVAAAKHAMETTDWGENPRKRATALYKLAQALKSSIDWLAPLLTREGGKPLSVSRAEVTRGADAIEYYAGLARNVYGRSTMLEPDSLAILIREPIGVVSIVVPWNMALSLLTRSLAPALAAGNAVVIKPSSVTPGATAEFIQMIDAIPEFPKGIVNFVVGPGSTTGAELVRHPDVDMVAFTGDTSTGKEIMKMAADTLKKVGLELGGKSPNIVFEDANFDRAVRGALNGASMFHAGQVCVAGSRVLVQESIHDRFVEKLAEMANRLRVGYGLDEGVQAGPVISEGQLNRVLGYVETGKQEAELVTGGKRLTEGKLAQGYFVAPTIFDHVPTNATIAQEEIFGPVLTVHTFKDEAEAAEIANATVYGLAGAVWTNDMSKALRIAKKVKSGMVWVNTFGKLFPAGEMGGYKQSGIGRQYGLEGLWEYTEMKHINVQL
ncbi:MAG TPA: aldehyde dehydrogenase family protein [Chloroflexota bacterium]|nr:aldehyde dehydrogenase family protein [Chloroflexota bacterium]